MQGIIFGVIFPILVLLEHVERSAGMNMNPSGSSPPDHQDIRFANVPDRVRWNGRNKHIYLLHCERDVRKLRPLVDEANEILSRITYQPAKDLYEKFYSKLVEKEMQATENFHQELYGLDVPDLERFDLGELEEKYKKEFEKRNWRWPSLQDDGGRSSAGASSSYASSSNPPSTPRRTSRTHTSTPRRTPRTPRADEDYVLGEHKRLQEVLKTDNKVLQEEESKIRDTLGLIERDKYFPIAVLLIIRCRRQRLKDLQEEILDNGARFSNFNIPARFLKHINLEEENMQFARELYNAGVTWQDYQKLLDSHNWRKLPSFRNYTDI